MGNRYLLLNVKLEVLKFGHIGELQLHLKDMWELSGTPSNDFCVHRGSDRLASLDGRRPVPNTRLAPAAPSTREETGVRRDADARNRRVSGPLGQLPPLSGVIARAPADDGAEQRPAPLINPEKMQRLRRRQDLLRRQQVGEQIVSGNQLDQDRGRTI